MTYEEALKTLEEKYIGIGSNDVLVFRKAAVAINKQIPMTPDNVLDLEMELRCPCCYKEIELWPIDDDEITYCLHCGQALDWSDAE